MSCRNELTQLRRLWSAWQTFMRIRMKEKMEQMKQHYEAELYVVILISCLQNYTFYDFLYSNVLVLFSRNETPNEALRVSG